MSLKYGLNLKKKAPAAPVRRTVFDDEDEDNDDENNDETRASPSAATAIAEFSSGRAREPAPTKPPPPSSLRSRPPARAAAAGESAPPASSSRQDLSSLRAAEAKAAAAEAQDASIFDYDAFHTAKASVAADKAAAAREDARARKPKYIDSLLDAAARRKQDQTVAREKLLQREREAEGDEFADKEKFVTGAYKQQQEETRRLEEEEARRAEEEEARRRRLGGGSGGGMQGFYRSMMDQSERQHREVVEATERMEREGGVRQEGAPGQKNERSDADLAAEMKAKGVNVHLNDEGQITDKRQLLSAGLNVGASGRSSDKHAADHLKVSNRPRESAFHGRSNASQQSQRERQSRMLEEQLEVQAKRAREEEEEERERLEKAVKSTKTDKDVSDAKARFLARKAARERGEG